MIYDSALQVVPLIVQSAGRANHEAGGFAKAARVLAKPGPSGYPARMSDPQAGFYLAAAAPVLAAALVYRNGARRRTGAGRPVSTARHIAFALGLAVLFVSVEWPFEGWAHRLFYVHQIGMLAARILAPILLVLSHPAGILIAGLPRPLRHEVLRPVLSWPAGKRLLRVIGHPAIVLPLYVGALYLWEIPVAQAAALSHPAIGYAMHLSLLMAGLAFWSRILGRRPAPHGISHGARLMMIWIAILTQIALGAYITVKTTIIYAAYGAAARFGGVPALVDEERGGFFIWIPSALLCLVALIVVIDMLGRHETRMDERRRRWSPSNSAILLYPETGRALRRMARGKNRRMAIGMAGFALLVFGAVMGIVTSAHRLNRRDNIRQYMMSRS